MKKLEGSSINRGLWVVYLLGLDPHPVDLEWGIVLLMVSQSVHKKYKTFLVMGTDKNTTKIRDNSKISKPLPASPAALVTGE